MKTFKLTFSEDMNKETSEEVSQQRTFKNDYSSSYYWNEEDEMAKMFVKLMKVREMSDESRFAVLACMWDLIGPPGWVCRIEGDFETFNELTVLNRISTVFRSWRYRTDATTYTVPIHEPDKEAAAKESKELLDLGAKKDGLWRVLERMFELEQEWKAKHDKQMEDYEGETVEECCDDPGGSDCRSDG